LLPSLSSPLKSHQCTTFLQYLGKYAFVRRATRKFWNVLLHTYLYLLNKWPLKFACAYLNTQESSPSGTPLKRLQDERFLHYREIFVEIAKSCAIFLRCGQVDFSSFSVHLESIYRNCFRMFWKVLLHTNPSLLNKWPLKFACAYLNTQKSSPFLTPFKRLQNGNVFCIIVRYSLKLRSLVQYFFVLGKSIFLHFPSNWNKFINIVSGRIEM
ncbi:hypothetical protein T01_7774, partial [Trichinella spiralis]